MIKIFNLVIKWAISTSLAICGCFFLAMADETGSVKPLFIALLSFGIVYWMYGWGERDVSKPRIAITSLVLASAFLVTEYVHIDNSLFNFGGFHFTFWIWTLVVGMPVMAMAYKIYD